MSDDKYQSPTRIIADLSAQVRGLQWKLKQLGKQAGKQGQTIFELRNENAALREAVHWSPGDRARLYGDLRRTAVELRRAQEENRRLRADNEGMERLLNRTRNGSTELSAMRDNPISSDELVDRFEAGLTGKIVPFTGGDQ